MTTNPILQCSKLEKKYTSGQRSLTVLHKLDLRVPAGQWIAITGESGSGKSTLLHLLGALDEPTAGEIRFDDISIHTLSESKRNRIRNEHFGFVFQFHYLLAEFNARENVALPGMITGKSDSALWQRAENLLRELKLSERMDHRPTQLSGGEQQRVAVARALINQPKILFMDEPTGNLDPSSSNELIDMIQEQKNLHNLTIVMVTHNPEIATRADTHLVLEQGSLRGA